MRVKAHNLDYWGVGNDPKKFEVLVWILPTNLRTAEYITQGLPIVKFKHTLPFSHLWWYVLTGIMGDAPSSSSSTVATSIPPFIDKVVDFPETGVSYRLERPLATYKQCHDGVPAEARMVFTCKRVKHESASSSVEQTDRDSDAGAEFVMKIKVQYVIPTCPPPGKDDVREANLRI